jgi:anti-sigma factor RsiW
MMFGIVCRYHQAHLDAYLDGNLTPKARKRVAQHIGNCEACYAEYARRRDFRNELQRTLPLVGQRQNTIDFDQVWDAIRVELPLSTRRRTHARYGLVALMFMLVLMLPFTMGHRAIPMTLPPHPAPDTNEQNTTPAQTETVAVATVVVSVTEGHNAEAATKLPTVPEPEATRGRHGN